MDREQELFRIHLIFPQADLVFECRFSAQMSLRQMLQKLVLILPPECLQRCAPDGKVRLIQVYTGAEADMDVSAGSLNLHDDDVFFVI
ncbi:MAG: hypothetical protein K6A40_11090 [Solobacterium sp.]|nr:hypothetical protein [Solobacterium sp.]